MGQHLNIFQSCPEYRYYQQFVICLCLFLQLLLSIILANITEMLKSYGRMVGF